VHTWVFRVLSWDCQLLINDLSWIIHLQIDNGMDEYRIIFSGYGCLLDALAMQMTTSSSSHLSILVIERIDERAGLSCVISLLSPILVSSACERYKYVSHSFSLFLLRFISKWILEMSPHHMFFWLIRVLDDMCLWVILNFVPCIAIPAMLFLFPPKYCKVLVPCCR
jgi:hypothetical protein